MERGNIMKGKSKQNFVIDAIMFLTMMALTGTGFLTRYVLLSGQAGREVYGEKVDMSMLGITKDSWHAIHLYLGVFLLILLVLHIWLHWKQICVMYHQLIAADRTRQVVLVIFILISIMLVVFPYIIPVEIGEGEVLNQGAGRSR